MTTIFFRIMEFSVYGVFWLLLFFLVSLLAGSRRGVLWQYFVAVCIALHLLIPVHIQWTSVDIPYLQNMNQGIAQDIDRQNGLGENQVKQSAKAVDGRDERQSDVDVGGNSTVGGLESWKTAALDVQAQNSSQVELEESGSATRQEQGPDGSAGKKGNYLVSLEWLGQMDGVFFLELLWILGMLFFFGKMLISYIAFRRQAKRWSLPPHPLAEQVLEEVKAQYGIGRRVRLWRNCQVHSPMLTGVIKPMILLPEKDYSEEEYRYIFQHELCHYRHGDILMKYIFTVCRGVYWFHPLVHWMCGRAYGQMEILCDDAVVGGAGIEEKRAYSMVILRHMTDAGAFHSIPLATSFYGGKKYMKQRFKNIMGSTKKKVGWGAVLLAVVVVLALGGVKWGYAADIQQGEIKDGKTIAKKDAADEKVSSRKILVIGADVIGSDKKTSGYADAIMLVDVDAENGKITVDNIPRDLLVDFGNLTSRLSGQEKEDAKVLGEQKLSAAFAGYGYGMVERAVEDLYQTDIDSHIVLNYTSVPQIIDAAGGVEITLTKKEADYLNKTNYISEQANRNVKEGKQMLNGDQTTGYLRIRQAEAGSPVVDGKKSTEQDAFGRAQRCNNVILGLAAQIQKNKVDWTKMVKSLVQGRGDAEVDVDISAKELILLIKKVIAGELEITISDEQTSASYVYGVSEEIGSYLQRKE